ncbi:MAG: ATP-binding cassette domain-containing protein [Thermoleophilia bacterium]|nr:ATP-binding cassette domain-containing protein [Thermoleophilia bacterium]
MGGFLGALPRELSGGMRQRVALARTLVLSKGLVLLDEPFGSLDALTRAELQGWLLDVMEAHPATWVLVTHDVREAVLLGDRVAVLAGRPARLEGWVPIPLGRGVRRALAAAEAGEEPAVPAADPVAPGGVAPAAGEEMRSLIRRVRQLLARGRTA